MQQGTHRVKMIKRKKNWVSVGLSSLALLLTTGMLAPTMVSATEVTVTATASVKVDFTVQVGAVRVAPETEVTEEMILGQISGYPKDAKLTLLEPISGRLNGLPAGESVLVSVSVMANGTNKIVDVPVVITEAKDQVIDQKRQEQEVQRQKAEDVKRQAEEAKRRQVEDAKRKEAEKKRQIAQDERIQEPTIRQEASGVTVTPAKEASFLEVSFVNTEGATVPIVVIMEEDGTWSSKNVTTGVTVAEKTGVVTISSEVLGSGTTIKASDALPSGKTSSTAKYTFEVKETSKAEKKDYAKQDLANKETEKRQAEKQSQTEPEKEVQAPIIKQEISGVTITPTKEAKILEFSFVDVNSTPIFAVVVKEASGTWSGDLPKSVSLEKDTGVVTIASDVLEGGTIIRAINAVQSGRASNVAMHKVESLKAPKEGIKDSSEENQTNQKTEKRQVEERKREEEAKREAEANTVIAFMDNDSGVSISGKKKYLAKVASIKVVKTQTPSLAESVSDIYDLTLWDKDGQAVQPGGKVTVTAPTSGEVDKVYYVNGDQKESLDFSINADNTVSFETDHFSLYAVIYHLSNVPQTEEDKDSTPPAEKPMPKTKGEEAPKPLPNQESKKADLPSRTMKPSSTVRSSAKAPKAAPSRRQLPRTGVALTKQELLTEQLFSMLLSVLGALGVTGVAAYWWHNELKK